MKQKITILVLGFTIIGTIVNAPSKLSNSGFQDWESTSSYPTPVSWWDGNVQQIAQSNNINDTSLVKRAGYKSNYGVLVKPIVGLDKAGYSAAYAGYNLGVITTGSKPIINAPFTSKLDSMKFYYKNIYVNTPAFFNTTITCALFHGTDTVASAKSTLTDLGNTNYTLEKVAFTYNLDPVIAAMTPDSITFQLVVLSDSATGNSKK